MVTNDDGTRQPLLGYNKLENTLLEYSQTHFARVEGSPFMQEPLGCLLQYDGLTSFGDRVTSGWPVRTLHHFDKPTTAILKNLCRKTPADMLPPTLDHEKLLEGIKKWLERTTTSPSGRHLGIYKTLGKHLVQTNKKNDQPASTPKTLGPLKQGCDVLYLIFDIMVIALKHAYPLQRWGQVWTIFIEKEFGNPELNRLRCLMIFKADWQLLLKWHSSYGFLPKTEHTKTLVYEQGGGWKGHSAIDQATQQIVETETIHMNQQPTIDMYLDLRACFNLMVEACHNLACCCHGATDDYLHLHAQMHQMMRYFSGTNLASLQVTTRFPTPMAWRGTKCCRSGTLLYGPLRHTH